MSMVALGFLASLIAGLLAALGAIPVLFGRSISRRQNDLLLGFAAGVMLAASFFSLIMPGVEIAKQQFGGSVPAALVGSLGVTIGVGFIAALNEYVPHEHFSQGHQGPVTEELSRTGCSYLPSQSTICLNA